MSVLYLDDPTFILKVNGASTVMTTMMITEAGGTDRGQIPGAIDETMTTEIIGGVEADKIHGTTTGEVLEVGDAIGGMTVAKMMMMIVVLGLIGVETLV